MKYKTKYEITRDSYKNQCKTYNEGRNTPINVKVSNRFVQHVKMAVHFSYSLVSSYMAQDSVTSENTSPDWIKIAPEKFFPTEKSAGEEKRG